ncbi:substrate-binding periplasmic protein [Desulforapulum autotrophicum]|nr:transporter substrate-binding domain-containing protein [Desulforapulum autotrophicum]
MKIAYPEFYPFFSKPQNGKIEGFFYEILTEALEHRMVIHTQWFQMPWKRCQNQVRIGKMDAMITFPTEERLTYCDTHPDPFYLKELKLFTYKGHKRLNEIQQIGSIADIKKGGYTVITYSGNGWNTDNITTLGIPSFETSEVHNVWKMLAAKRGDLVIEWPVGVKASLDKDGLADKIVETGVLLSSMPFHLLIGKQSGYTHILAGFNDVIQRMLDDGTIKRIIVKYY